MILVAIYFEQHIPVSCLPYMDSGYDLRLLFPVMTSGMSSGLTSGLTSSKISNINSGFPSWWWLPVMTSGMTSGMISGMTSGMTSSKISYIIADQFWYCLMIMTFGKTSGLTSGYFWYQFWLWLPVQFKAMAKALQSMLGMEPKSFFYIWISYKI